MGGSEGKRTASKGGERKVTLERRVLIYYGWGGIERENESLCEDIRPSNGVVYIGQLYFMDNGL